MRVRFIALALFPTVVGAVVFLHEVGKPLPVVDNFIAGTCDIELHDKVFENCRRNIVDKMYEYYKDNRDAVNYHCGMLAQETTCTSIGE